MVGLYKLVALLTFLSTLYAFRIVIPPAEKVCFFEILSKQQKMGINFQVEEGGNYDIDLLIRHVATNQEIYKGTKESYGTYSFIAGTDGKYEFCFNNEFSKTTSKKLSFTVLGLSGSKETSIFDSKEDPIQEELQILNSALRQVKDDQEYLSTRDKIHHSTAQSTNSRVLWWSLFQTILLVGVCFWQVYYLKRFFEVKRVV